MNTPRLLILSRYSRRGASSRLRTMQYIPYLEGAGIEVKVASLFDDAYLDALYGNRATLTRSLGGLARRVSDLIGARRNQALWVEKEALPWVPWSIERQLYPASVPVVSDYDDAVFHRYDHHPSALVRRALRTKIDSVMSHSALVLAGNDYLGSRAKAAGAQRIEIVPTVVDTTAYQVRTRDPDAVPNIGWIGTPETWAAYGAPMLPILKEVTDRGKARFTAVGAGQHHNLPPWLQFLPWSEETEIASIQNMDIGIMPIPDDPWARGKCGYKLIQYMACGLPVVASPVGVNCRIVEPGGNGFLASKPGEWRDALDVLVGNPELRRRMGCEGRAKVERQYSLQLTAPRLAGLFSEVMRGSATVTGHFQ